MILPISVIAYKVKEKIVYQTIMLPTSVIVYHDKGIIICQTMTFLISAIK